MNVCILGIGTCADGGVAGALLGAGLGQLAEAITEGVGTMVTALGSVWVMVPSPILVATDGSSPSNSVAFVRGSLFVITAVLLLVSFVVAGVRLMIERRGEPARQLLFAVLRFVLIQSGGLFVLALVVSATDALAVWVLDSSTRGTDFAANVTAMLGLATTSGLGVLLVIVFGFVAVCVSMSQVALMVVRTAMLPLVAGVWPTAAAFTTTEQGRSWFNRLTGWLVALTFYKLAAAVIYGLAFRMTGSRMFGADPTGVVTVIAGLTLMVLALLALPALMRLIAPMTAQLGAGSGGGAAAGMLAGTLASGAINAGQSAANRSSTTSGSGGGSRGRPDQQGPDGPSGSNQPTTGGPANANTAAKDPGAASSPSSTSKSGATTGNGKATQPGASAGAQTGGTGAGGGAASGTAASGAGVGAASGGAAASGAAAAAGPAAPIALGAQAVIGAAQSGVQAAKGAAESQADGPSGASK